MCIRDSLLLLLNFILSTAELALSYSAFSIDIALEEAVLMEAISRFSGIIKILPGNLGIYEGSIALGSQILNVGFSEGLLAAGLVRVVSICVILIFGLIFGLRLFVGGPNPGLVVSVIDDNNTAHE